MPIKPTRLQATCDRIRALAHELGPDAKLPTVLQLRDELGVSLATVNSALGELEAEDVVVRRHGVGVFVSPTLHRKTIALLCYPGFFEGADASPFWSILVEQARRRAEERGEDLRFQFARPWAADEMPVDEGFAAQIDAGRIHGVLCVGLEAKPVEWLQRRGLPIVAFAGPGPCTVALDSLAMVRMGAEQLVEQGCRRIGFWSPIVPERPTVWDTVATAETSEMRATLAANGLALDDALVWAGRRHAAFDRPGSFREQGYRAATTVFSQPRDAWPDGVVINDDMMAQGALTALQRLGVRPGIDVRIASHANAGSSVLLGFEDTLTIVEMNPPLVVATMFEMLDTLMSGRQPKPRCVWIPPRVRPTALTA